MSIDQIVRITTDANCLDGYPDRNVWLSWVNLVLGLWLIIASFTLGHSGMPAAMWNDISLGVIVAALAGWSVWATRNQ